jgi:hypothetical protein
MAKLKKQPPLLSEDLHTANYDDIRAALAVARTELFAAELDTGSINEDKRTVDCVFYSGATVDRRDWWTGEKYLLRLSLDPAHVRLGRLNDGAAVLDSHSSYSVREQPGVVEKGWLENGKGMASLRFDDDESGQMFWGKVKKKIVRKVSMGLNIHKLQDVTPDEEREKVKTYLAVDWEPFEISLVSVPADPGAGFLSAQLGRIDMSGALIQSKLDKHEERAEKAAPQEETTVTEHTALVAAVPPTAGAGSDPVDQEKLKLDAKVEERGRILEIRKVGMALGLDTKFADQHVERGTELAQFRVDAINEKARIGDDSASRSHTTLQAAAHVTRDERETRINAMTMALMHRYQPGTHKLDDASRQYRGMTLVRLAEECLVVAGVKVRGLSQMDIATRALQFSQQATIIGEPSVQEFGAMSTSDFPFITANVANKTLRAAYAAEPQTWRPFARQANASDFKAKYVNQLGDAPSLELVPESGEFKYGSIPEARESYRLYTYGKILPFTRQLIINDDMNAFTRVPELQGRSVARLENTLIWGQITSNPTMGDSIALFDASTHKNYTASGTAISVDSLGVGRTTMRVQTGLGGTEVLNLTPKFLLVPAAKEQLGLQYTSMNFVPTSAANQNVWAGLLTPIVEPRLDTDSATAWYLVADPAQIDTIEFAYLEGQEGAYYETRMGFNVDGMEMKVRHDFGRKVIDFRAFYKNAGA